jgi:hypothetical protein
MALLAAAQISRPYTHHDCLEAEPRTASAGTIREHHTIGNKRDSEHIHGRNMPRDEKISISGHILGVHGHAITGSKQTRRTAMVAPTPLYVGPDRYLHPNATASA